MSDYLDASCVFSTLFEKKILIEKEWQLSKATEEYYVSFELKDTPKIMGFLIYVIDCNHYLGVTALENQSKRFNIPKDIIVKCAVVL